MKSAADVSPDPHHAVRLGSFIQQLNVVEPLGLNGLQCPLQQGVLVHQRLLGNPSLPGGVARETSLNRNIEDNGRSVEMKRVRDLGQHCSVFSLQVSRIGDRQPSEPQPLFDDEVHQVECVLCDGLIGRIVEDYRTALIGGDDLSR